MAKKITIYHNPRCSKSRQTLALLQEKGIEPEVILYMEQPPSTNQLKSLIKKLGIRVIDLVRVKEQDFKDLGLSKTDSSDDELLLAMNSKPKLIERPIVECGSKAVLGRPPENVLELL